MKKLFTKLEKWFEIKIGWFFVNGNNQERYAKYLNQKYNKTSIK